MGLTKGQQKALTEVRKGNNAFITGGGGVGKSYIVRYIVSELQAAGKTVLITASTGKAATLIDGVTCHRDMNQEMEPDEDSLRNIGYAIFKRLYQELELSSFWRKATRGMDIEFDADKIFQVLVYARILFPASKRKTYQDRKRFFEDFGDFSLDDVYKALTIFGQHEAELQKWIYDHSVTKYHRDLETVFFDCTNYYYDISKPDVDDLDDEGNVILQRYRKYGPEKNHRKDPIVELGLLMDNTGIPLAYDLFPGNESEKVHMLPIIQRMRSDYGVGRVIVVADRGLNTSDNIFKLNGQNKADNNLRDGYVYGQSVSVTNQGSIREIFRSRENMPMVISASSPLQLIRSSLYITPKSMQRSRSWKGTERLNEQRT